MGVKRSIQILSYDQPISRYEAVRRPHTYSTMVSLRRPRAKVMVAWVTGLVLAMPVLASPVNTTHCYLEMEGVPWLVVYLPIVCFFLPLVIMVLVYTIIFTTMRTKIQRRHMAGEVFISWS